MTMAVVASGTVKECRPKTFLKSIQCDFNVGACWNLMIVISDYVIKMATTPLNRPPPKTLPFRRKYQKAVRIRTGLINDRSLERRSRSFKVTDFGTSRKHIGYRYDFLLQNNTNLHRISHHFRDIEVYWSHVRLCLYLAHSFETNPTNIAIN